MPTDSLHITLFIHHIQRFGPRLRSRAVVRCSCPLDAAVTLLPSPWCSAVCPTDATSRTTDVCAGGPFSLRRTFQHWYELHYLTESLQYFIQFLYFTLIESLLLNCPGFVQPSYEYDNSSFNLEDLDNLDADDRDVLGSSQLGGAPPLPSQEPAFQTPEPTVRPSRQAASPDRLSYPTGHVHAQQRAKRVRRGRGG